MEDYLPLPPHYLTYLQKVIDTSRRENFRLLFADTLWYGFSNPVYDLYDRSDEFRLLSREAIPYHDFRSYPLAYNWQQIHLYDRDHPSEFGSLIISVTTAEMLAKTMDIPVDVERLEYYRNFFFNSHNLEQANGQTSLTLVPANPSAPLRYRWALLAADQRTVLGEILESSGPSYRFKTPPAGTYWIAVAVTQPGGSYELEGLFPLVVE
jgi:hypothetical protein